MIKKWLFLHEVNEVLADLLQYFCFWSLSEFKLQFWDTQSEALLGVLGCRKGRFELLGLRIHPKSAQILLRALSVLPLLPPHQKKEKKKISGVQDFGEFSSSFTEEFCHHPSRTPLGATSTPG